MRSYIKSVLLVLMLVCVASGTIWANSLVSRVYLFEEGVFSFHHAPNMRVTLTADATSLTVGDFFLPQPDASLLIQVSRPTPHAAFERFGFGTSPEAVLLARVRLWEQTAQSMLTTLLGTLPQGAFSAMMPTSITVNGYPASIATHSYSWATTQSVAVFVAVVDVGQNHLVTLVASAPVGEGTLAIAQAEGELLLLLDSLRFTPNVENVAVQPLPLSYMGEIGRLHTGLLSFTYPKNWYILPVGGNVLITNTNQLAINQLMSGQVQTQIIPPDFNLMAFADREQIVNCTIPESTLAQISPSTVLERQMLSEARLADYERTGVTYIAPQTTRIGERNAAYMTLFTPDRDAFVIAVDLGNGNIASLMAFSAPNEMNHYTTALFSIAASLRYETNACQPLDANRDL